MDDLLDSQSAAESSGGNWLKFLDTAGGVAGKVLGALNPPKTNTPTTAKATTPTWLPYALIGGGVLLLLVIVGIARK